MLGDGGIRDPNVREAFVDEALGFARLRDSDPRSTQVALSLSQVDRFVSLDVRAQPDAVVLRTRRHSRQVTLETRLLYEQRRSRKIFY